MWKKYGVGRGKTAAQVILPQPAKSLLLLLPLLLLLLLPTLLLLKPLLLLTSQMATLGLPGQGQAQDQTKIQVSGVLGLSGTSAGQNPGLEIRKSVPEKIKSGLNRLKMAPFDAIFSAN